MINLEKYIVTNFDDENSEGALDFQDVFYMFFNEFRDMGVTPDKILRNGKIKHGVIEAELPYVIDAINVTKYFAKYCVNAKRMVKDAVPAVRKIKNTQFKGYSGYTDSVYTIDHDQFTLNIIMRLYHPESYTNNGSIHIMVDLLYSA